MVIISESFETRENTWAARGVQSTVPRPYTYYWFSLVPANHWHQSIFTSWHHVTSIQTQDTSRRVPLIQCLCHSKEMLAPVSVTLRARATRLQEIMFITQCPQTTVVLFW